MTALITADETQVESCREFIRKHCDPEYLEVFDIYWAGNDERKMEKISELQEESNMYMDEQDRKLQERMKSEGKIKISKGDFEKFVKKYFLEHYNLEGEFDFLTASYSFFDEQHQVLDLNEGKWVDRPEERKVTEDIPSFITKDGYEKLERLGIYHPGIPERMKINIPGLIEQEKLDEEIGKILNNDEVSIIKPEIMESILRENGYTDIFYDHYFYSIMDMPSYNIYAKPFERVHTIVSGADDEKEKQLHTKREAEGYAKDGLDKYTDIGQMYSSYLTRDSKEEVRSEENERN